MDLNASIPYYISCSEIYDKRKTYFDIVDFLIWMATSFALYPMEYIVLNLFVLPEHAVKSVTLVIGIKESEINIPKSYFGKNIKAIYTSQN